MSESQGEAQRRLTALFQQGAQDSLTVAIEIIAGGGPETLMATYERELDLPEVERQRFLQGMQAVVSFLNSITNMLEIKKALDGVEGNHE